MGILFLAKKEFLPSAACGGGGASAKRSRGGVFPTIVGISPPPKNSLARIFTPPRKRRRVKKYFHSGESRNLCGEAAFAKSDHCNVPLRGIFSLSPPLLPFPRRRESLRRSRIRQRRPMQCSASRNILAYRPPPSIPAKAGISAAKPHSPKTTDAMFRFAEYSRLSPPSFHSREGGNLCGEAAFAEGDRCNVPLRGKFSLSRE